MTTLNKYKMVVADYDFEAKKDTYVEKIIEAGGFEINSSGNLTFWKKADEEFAARDFAAYTSWYSLELVE